MNMKETDKAWTEILVFIIGYETVVWATLSSFVYDTVSGIWRRLVAEHYFFGLFQFL